MDPGGGLGGLAWRFVSHPMRRQLAKFLVDQRQQFLGGSGITLLHAVEDARDVAQGGAFCAEPPLTQASLWWTSSAAWIIMELRWNALTLAAPKGLTHRRNAVMPRQDETD
jgi:hypothetical protein